MNSEPKNRILQSTLKAQDRFLIRLQVLQAGYLLILRAENIALNGDEMLSKNLNDLNEKLKPVNMNAHQYFLSILFLDMISEVEIYFSSILRAVISEYPKKLGSTNFKLSEVIDSNSIDELVARASDEFVNKLMYKKPLEYLDSVCDMLSIEKNSIIDYWPNYVEAKARRDLGTHNSWICNAIYLRKLNETNIQTNATEGDMMIPVWEGYVDELLYSLGTLVIQITGEIGAKYK